MVVRLRALGIELMMDPVSRLNALGRPEGHATHNLLVRDKRDKERRYLVTLRQSSPADLKALAGTLGCKELRLCADGEALLGSRRGCLTPLSLLYDEPARVQWAVDEALLEPGAGPWRLGTSADGAAVGTVADVPPAALEALLTATGHWQAKLVIHVP